MAKASDNQTREERLAAKLRENLKRRKAQARAQSRPTHRPGEDREDMPPLPKGEAKS